MAPFRQFSTAPSALPHERLAENGSTGEKGVMQEYEGKMEVKGVWVG